MIDLIDESRKIIFRFTTDEQAAVEKFCLMIGHHYRKGGAIFSTPAMTGERRKWRKYGVTIVKTKITMRGYKYVMGDSVQEELG